MRSGAENPGCVALVVVYVVLTVVCVYPVGATITTIGDIDPAYDSSDPWILMQDLVIGATTDASLGVLGGSRIVSEETRIGADVGGNGVVLVAGAGSHWESLGILYVGDRGIGTATISAGASLVATEVFLGNEVSSLGYLVVTGPGTTWQGGSTEDITPFEIFPADEGSLSETSILAAVGQHATGYVTISDGARVTAEGGLLYLGYGSNGVGSLIVTGPGTIWEDTGTIRVGHYGTGSLLIQDGAAVTTTNTAYIGDTSATSRGHATVGDSGSLWRINGGLYIGGQGHGELYVSAGGQVQSGFGHISSPGPEVSVATITGANSLWWNDTYLAVGHSGPGRLAIDFGGRVTSQTGFVGYSAAGEGEVVVNGSGSLWENSGSLMIGEGGQGIMTILDGGRVTSLSASMGESPGGEGSVMVRGAGSLWQNQEALYVGKAGRGELTISEGGRVESGYVRIASDSSEPSRVMVTGTDSLLQLTYYVTVGNGGRMDIDAGGRVTDFEGVAGGVIRVDGPGSTWTNDSFLGVHGGADVTISNGGQLSSGGCTFQALAGTTGSVVVTGAGSLWDNPGQLLMGYTGNTSLLISDGGHVITGSARVEADEGGTAVITVTGANSRWTNVGPLTVGDLAYSGPLTVYDPASYGTIAVRDGGTVESNDIEVWVGSVLTGDGTFRATQITNHGILRPGTSIGTLTIDGNLSLRIDGVLEVEVDNSGHSDLLDVTGDFTIEGGTVRPVASETIVGARQYTIVEASSVAYIVVAAGFGVPDTALLDFDMLVGPDSAPNAVLLNVAALPFDDPDVAQTDNQSSLGSALQRIAEDGGNDLTLTLQQLETGEEIRRVYNQLSGQTTPSLAPVSVAGTTRHVGMISGRLRNPAGGLSRDDGLGASSERLVSGTDTLGIDARRYLFAVGNGAPVLGDKPWGVWGKGYGLYGDRESESSVPGYQYTIYGAAFGVDYRFTEQLLLGFTGGYSDGDIDQSGSRDSADVSATHGGLYGSYEASRWYLDSILTYADLDYETRRYVDLVGERLEGDPSGDMLTGYLEAGLNLWRSGPTAIQPLAAFQFSTLHIDRFTETGGDSALTFDDERYESYKGSLGAKLTRQLFDRAGGFRMDLELRGRWVHEFGDTQATFDAGFASDPGVTFRVSDKDISRDSAILGAGLDTWFTRQTRLFVDYGTELNPDNTIHLVSAGLEHRW